MLNYLGETIDYSAVPKEVRLHRYMNRNFGGTLFSFHTTPGVLHRMGYYTMVAWSSLTQSFTGLRLGVVDKISCHSVSAALDGDI